MAYQPRSIWFQSLYLSILFWFLTYSSTISLSIHIVLTKYHLDQKLFWVRDLFLFQNLLYSIIAVFHFIVQITFATEYLGGIFKIIWIWSNCMVHFIISTHNLSAIVLKNFQTVLYVCLYNIFLLYLGTITMWYIQSQDVWELLLTVFIITFYLGNNLSLS